MAAMIAHGFVPVTPVDQTPRPIIRITGHRITEAWMPALGTTAALIPAVPITVGLTAEATVGLTAVVSTEAEAIIDFILQEVSA
jgi:hypothetical protein